MKKLMMAAAIVCAAALAQAATVDWQYSITGAEKTKNLYDGYTCYLVNADAWKAAALEGITADTFADTSVVYDHTTFDAGSGKSSYTFSTMMQDGTAGVASTDISTLAEGSTVQAMYVILDTNKDPNEYFTSSEVTLTGRGSSAEQIKTGFGTVAKADMTYTKVGGGGDVPEPTSGLLLLLGMAGLALRRKQA